MHHIKSDEKIAKKVYNNLKKVGLNSENLPKHIAIIMDGNGRWAKEKNLDRNIGHNAGVDSLRNVIKLCIDYGIHYLSAYTFSSENWKRPKHEVKFLMNLLKLMIKKELNNLNSNGVRVRIIGDKSELSEDIQNVINTIESKTEKNSTLQLNLMINYGSRMEILNACETLHQKRIADPSFEFNEETFTRQLLTFDSPDPDLLIRPGGEFRLSNFMLWQLSYAEFFFTDTLWPDFTKDDFFKILLSYQNRHRRYGAL
tara:strand:+ start:723 stop:1490 length:768 start_codon:yes stop_codon:yes gene_type:complete